MFHSRTTLIIALFIGLFLFTQGLKRFQVGSPRAADRLQLDWKNLDYRPYQRTDIDRDPRGQNPRREGFKLAAVHALTKEGIEPAKAAAGQTKEDQKKKKKKKRKRPARGRILNLDMDRSVARQGAANARKSPLSASPSAAASPLQVSTPEPTLDETKSFEEWSALLLARPDDKMMYRFIRDFQSNLISPDVYYTILELMLEKNTPEFIELAIRGAGAVPNMRSFDFLMLVLSRVPQNSPSAALAQEAVNEFQTYAGLPVLREVLLARIEDTIAVTLAIRALDAATARILTPNNSSQPGEAPSEGPARTPSVDHSQKMFFQSFIQPIQFVLDRHNQNINIAEPAARTLERIQRATNSNESVVAEL